MPQELHYTSVPRGLKAGSGGFCTVAHTPNLPGPLIERLEGLSGYQQIFPPHDERASLNPVAFSHLRITAGGRAYSVLSRVGFAGLDYSARSNKYAHHLVLDPTERPQAGPAWLADQPGVLQSSWEGEPRILTGTRALPTGDRPPGIAQYWGALTKDAGWAGVLAEAFLADPRKPAYLLFEPGMELLPLFVEAIALLPIDRRWDVEFSTYFIQLPQGTSCPWRGVLADSEESRNIHRVPGALILDLRRPLGKAEGGALVHLARTGKAADRATDIGDFAPIEPLGGHSERSSKTPGSSRPRSATHLPPDLGFDLDTAGASNPTRAPLAINVHDLEGFADDSGGGFPWKFLTAGLAAILLLVLGAAWWMGTFAMLKPESRKIIADAKEKAAEIKAKDDEARKAEADQKAAEDAKAKQSTAAQSVQPGSKDGSGVPKTSQNELVEAPAPAAIKNGLGQAASKPPVPLPLLFGLPEISSKGEGYSAENTALSITLPGPIKLSNTMAGSNRPPLRIIHKRIDADIVPEPKTGKSSQTEENLFLKSSYSPPLVISIPSSGQLTDDNISVARFSVDPTKDKQKIQFSWDPAGLKQRSRATIVRNAVLEAMLEDGRYFYVVLREPKLKKQRILFRQGEADQHISRGEEKKQFAWADKQSLEDCDWDLVITDWRIECTTRDQKPTQFARMTDKTSSDSVARIILNELAFSISVKGEQLTATFQQNVDLAGNEIEGAKRQTEIEVLHKQLNTHLAELRSKITSEPKYGVLVSLFDQFSTSINERETLRIEQQELATRMALYELYLRPKNIYLDVTLGLKLRDGKVIELAKIGDPIPPKTASPNKR